MSHLGDFELKKEPSQSFDTWWTFRAENYSRLMKVKAVICDSIYTMAIVYWCCSTRHNEKCRKSWSTGTYVISVRNSEYICPTRSISRSKHNFESNSKIFWNGEIPCKNWNRMTNMLLRDLFSIQAIFAFLTEYQPFFQMNPFPVHQQYWETLRICQYL